MTICFERATLQHQDIIFKWLGEPHMMDFWDNSQAHKDDILNFIHGKKQHYFYGTTLYWISFIDQEPFSFLLSDVLETDQDLSPLQRNHMSPSGRTITLDFGIGSTHYLGLGLAAETLKAFVDFYKTSVDPLADTFFIDPDENNPRATHVYQKAGFERVGDMAVTSGAFAGHRSHLMVKHT